MWFGCWFWIVRKCFNEGDRRPKTSSALFVAASAFCTFQIGRFKYSLGLWPLNSMNTGAWITYYFIIYLLTIRMFEYRSDVEMLYNREQLSYLSSMRTKIAVENEALDSMIHEQIAIDREIRSKLIKEELLKQYSQTKENPN